MLEKLRANLAAGPDCWKHLHGTGGGHAVCGPEPFLLTSMGVFAMEHVDQTTAHARRSTLGTLSVVAVALLIIGGLNWGLVGLLNFDLVAALFGEMTVLSRLVYILVGISAIIALVGFKRLTRAA
jgi:uncharacterized protein